MRLVFGLLVLLLTWHGGMAYICNQLCTCTSDYTCSGCIPYAVTDTSSSKPLLERSVQVRHRLLGLPERVAVLLHQV